MAIKEINDTTFAKTSKGYWLIMFYSTWCGICVNIDFLKELTESVPELNIGRINIEENSLLSEKHSVIVVPTFILTFNGKEKARFLGIKDKEFLKSKFTLLKEKS